MPACCVLPLFFPRPNARLAHVPLHVCLYGACPTPGRDCFPARWCPDTVELDQQRTGERREGVIFGLFVFVQQTGFCGRRVLCSPCSSTLAAGRV